MITWDEKTDIVIVGSGIAGLSAAIEANKANASVIVFEKMKVTGGNTRISDGGLAAPVNYLQKKLGVEDSPDLFYEDMLRAGLGLNHPHLVKIVAERATEAIEWTRNVLGVDYLDVLQLHDIEYQNRKHIPLVINESIPFLNELKKRGLIRYAGIASYPIEVFTRVNDCAKIIS